MTLKFDEEVPRNELLAVGDIKAIGDYLSRTGRNARSAMGGMLEAGALYDLDHEHASTDPTENPYGASTVAAHRAQKKERRSDRAAYNEVREPWEEVDPFALTARPTLGHQYSARDVDDYVDDRGVSRRLKEVLRIDPVSHRLIELYCGDEGSSCDGAPHGRLTAVILATPAGGELLRREIRKAPHLQEGPLKRLIEVFHQKKKDAITSQSLTDAVREARLMFRKACARWNDTDRAKK
jgi:hypothetical protein